MEDKKIYKDTIVYINAHPLTKMYANDIGIECFQKGGYEVFYLDMSELSYSSTLDKYNKEYLYCEDGIVKCRTKEEVIEWIKKHSKNAWFFVLHRHIGFDFSERWLYRAFKKYGCNYIIKNIASIGAILNEDPVKVVTNTFGLFIQLKWNRVLRKIANRILRFFIARDHFYRAPSYCFAVGTRSISKLEKIFKKSEIIQVPSLDYSKAIWTVERLEKSKNKEILRDHYLLYIDQCLFDAPDAKLLGMDVIDKDIFLRKINIFFNGIEKITGKRVIIAGSQKYKYKGTEYGGRDIIYTRTSELTYYADLVIVHYSTALSFPVLFGKPVLFITIKELPDFEKRYINLCAATLRRSSMDIEEEFGIDKLTEMSKVDNNVYESFITKFIAEKKFEESFAEIVLKTLNGHNAKC